MTNLQKKFSDIGLALKSQFLERDEVIDGMLCAALAGEHVLLVGAPGSAKSALVTTFAKCVQGANYFEWLLSKFTVPEELFGPISVLGLKDEKYRRVTTAKLPEAVIGFVDEVFKGNSAILNTLLPIMNERKFYNNGAPVTIPLRMLVGASNELPDGAELAAVYDRFLVRFSVDYLEKADNWVRMIMGVPTGHSATVLLTDWDAARGEVAKVKFDESAARELHKLRTKLTSDVQIVLSDRRWRQCVGLLKAAAWLSGEDEVMEEHFSVLAAALWEERGQIAQVATLCKEASGTTSTETARTVKTISDLIDAIPPTLPGEKVSADAQNKMVAANRDGARAIARLKEMLTLAKTTRAKKVIEKGLVEVEAKLSPMRQLMRESLGL